MKQVLILSDVTTKVLVKCRVVLDACGKSRTSFIREHFVSVAEVLYDEIAKTLNAPIKCIMKSTRRLFKGNICLFYIYYLNQKIGKVIIKHNM